MSRRLPALQPSDLIRALEKIGFVVVRTRGSHHIVRSTEPSKQTITVPCHKRELKRGTLAAILRQVGISPDDLFDLL